MTSVIDRAKFFRALRPDKPGDDVKGQALFRTLTQQQVAGISRWLDLWESRPDLSDIRWLAYVLATNYWETGRRMWPVREIGRGRRRSYGKKRAPTHSGSKRRVTSNLIYYGRGDPQLTWYDNYLEMEKLTGFPLSAKPDLMLDPKISAIVTVEGMTRGRSLRGDFTGKALDDYFNNTINDPLHARRVVNGMDHASDIAAIYEHFLYALKVSVGDVKAEKPTVQVPTPDVKVETVGEAARKKVDDVGKIGGAAATSAVAAAAGGLDWKVVAAIVAAVVIVGAIAVWAWRKKKV